MSKRITGMQMSRNRTRTEAPSFARRRAPHALAVLTAIATGGCSLPPTSGLSSEERTPDTVLHAGGGSVDAAQSSSGSSSDSGLDDGQGSSSAFDAGHGSAESGNDSGSAGQESEDGSSWEDSGTGQDASSNGLADSGSGGSDGGSSNVSATDSGSGGTSDSGGSSGSGSSSGLEAGSSASGGGSSSGTSSGGSSSGVGSGSGADSGSDSATGSGSTSGSSSGSDSGSSASGSGGGCSGGLTACGGACVDTTASATNCGSCGHSCGVNAQGTAASCSSGRCQPLTWIATTNPIGLAVNETTIYWETGVGSLMSAPVAGTSVSTLFAAPPDAGAAMADSELNDLIVNSTSAYFAVNAGTSNYVQTVLLNGTGASTLDVNTDIADEVPVIALDSSALYVARFNIDEQGGQCPDTGIDVVPLNGGPTTTLMGVCFLVRVTVDSSQNLYWTDRGRPPGTVNPSVMTQSVSATAPTTIASATSPYGIAVYGGKLYWSDSGNIMVLTIGGSTSASVLASSPSPQDIVVDSSGVYWIDSGSAVMMAPLAGGAATTIAQGQDNAVALATNSTSVFWVNEGTPANNYVDGAVMRFSK
jgi:hypothetical protein